MPCRTLRLYQTRPFACDAREMACNLAAEPPARARKWPLLRPSSRYSSSAIVAFSLARARLRRLRTVPIATSRISAIASYE